MAFILLQTFLCIMVSSTLGEGVNGTGDIYITAYTSRDTQDGLRIVYRPMNVPGPYYGDNAVIAFYELNSEYGRKDYDQRINLTTYSRRIRMQSHSIAVARRYWYMDCDNSGIKVTAGKWFGYAVHILSYDRTIRFKDEYNFYQVPPSMSYCTLESYNSPPICYTCSQALDGELPPSCLTEATVPIAAKGQIYFSPRYETGEGVQIVYRSNASLLIGDHGEVWIGYYYFDSLLEAPDYYEEIISTKYNGWLKMVPNNRYIPDYYYVTSAYAYGDIIVTSGRWFGYAVHVFDSSEHLIYKDEYQFYQVPSSVSFCTVSSYYSWLTYTCDKALNGEPRPTTETTGESKAYNAKEKGVIAAAAIAPMVALIIILILCKKCRWRKVPESPSASVANSAETTRESSQSTPPDATEVLPTYDMAVQYYLPLGSSKTPREQPPSYASTFQTTQAQESAV